MKLKILPLTITAALTAALLFGGWFAYRHYGIEKPLDRLAGAVPGVTSAVVTTTNGQVNIDVRLKQDADVSEVYRKVKSDGASEIGGKKFTLTAEGQTNERLDKAWSYALFDVAQAMENRQYTGIREAMNKLSEQFPGMTADTSMDEDNVYVTLRDGTAAKFVILPRQPATLEVWPNA
ncbi:hypothetical protein [Cohnella yongneupensis]|uniref:Uncharacterized protein n=1 Tax=Cohnella yongneupensis TaxID=425006 RepID=A0ABW0R3J7_9BACL